MEVSDQLHGLTALPPGKNISVYGTEGWLGPRHGLGDSEKNKMYSPRARFRTADYSSHYLVTVPTALFWLLAVF
jgi:hypothetical protein